MGGVYAPLFPYCYRSRQQDAFLWDAPGVGGRGEGGLRLAVGSRSTRGSPEEGMHSLEIFLKRLHQIKP